MANPSQSSQASVNDAGIPGQGGDTRTRILDAVLELIRIGGVTAVTLSAVCRKASISKGGLIHYFPAKEDLVEAFLQRAGNLYHQMIEQAFKDLPPGKGRRAIALIDLFLNDKVLTESAANEDCAAVMLALIQSNRRGGAIRQITESVIELLVEDNLSRDLATTLLVAIDGLWLQSVIEVREVTLERARRLGRQLTWMVAAEMDESRQPSKLPLR